jgi:hypothetical protein
MWNERNTQSFTRRIRELERGINSRADGQVLMRWETVHGWGGMFRKTNPWFEGYTSEEKTPQSSTGGDDMADGRRNGSIATAFVSGVVLVLLGIGTALNKKYFWDFFQSQSCMALPEQIINVFASVVFGGILLWWAFSNETAGVIPPPNRGYLFYSSRSRNWGIGNDTVMMVVTVLTAVVIIFTFTHELFKEENPCRARTGVFASPERT